MRTLLIATAALASATAGTAQAQVMHGGGGHMGGGGWGGAGTSVRAGGGWGGAGTSVRTGGWGGSTAVRAGTWNNGVAVRTGGWNGGTSVRTGGWGGNRVGGDPRTWSPNGRGQLIGGDPRTWGPGNWNQNGNWGRNWNQNGNWGRYDRRGGYWQGGRWGQNIDGRWWGGSRAPGGWSGYHRPYRGWALPAYWQSGDWAINDWQLYGLGAPPAGYGWSRYYDDAVLLDGNGYVYDTVGGVDWRRGDQPYATGYNYPSQGYYDGPDNSYYGAAYGEPGCYPVAGRKRGGSGIVGALVGGAIGAGIGVATGGLGTALIAGGAGGLVGQQLDRESRRTEIVCDGPGPNDGYDDAGYAPGGVVYDQPAPVVQALPLDYGYPSAATATVTFDYGTPVTTTTTTTTTTEEYVSAPQKVVYRSVVKRAPVRRWKPTPPPCTCECGVVCGS